MAILDKLGFQADAVANGEEAVKAGKIQELNAHQRDIPIIALTADALREDSDCCFAAGINGYLAKPIDLNKLLEKIERLVL